MTFVFSFNNIIIFNNIISDICNIIRNNIIDIMINALKYIYNITNIYTFVYI